MCQQKGLWTLLKIIETQLVATLLDLESAKGVQQTFCFLARENEPKQPIKSI